MRRKIPIALVALGVLFGTLVAMQPSEFRVVRTANIAAPAPDVFAQVNDFHRWQRWSPWAQLDPNASERFEGPRAGKGAVFVWSGDDTIGEGRMTLTESRPSKLIRIRLDLVKPMEGHSTTEFTFEPHGNKTAVTWTMIGRKNLITKALCVFLSIDKTLGSDVERGLANLKSVVEMAIAQ